MWEFDHKEGWVLNNWCFWTVVLEKTLGSPLDYKEIQPVNPKENQLCIFIGRTDAEVEAPIVWPPDAKRQLIGKDPDAGRDWGQEEKGATKDEMVTKDWMASPTQWTWVWARSRRQWRTGKPAVVYVVHGVAKSWTWPSDWTATASSQNYCKIQMLRQVNGGKSRLFNKCCWDNWISTFKRVKLRDFPGVSAARLCVPHAVGPVPIPGGGTGSHMLQQRFHVLQLRFGVVK